VVLHAVGAGAVPSERTGIARFLDRLALVAGAAQAVVARGVEAKRAGVAALLDGPAGVAAFVGHAIVARAVVAEWTRSHFREGAHWLLGQRCTGTQQHPGSDQQDLMHLWNSEPVLGC